MLYSRRARSQSYHPSYESLPQNLPGSTCASHSELIRNCGARDVRTAKLLSSFASVWDCTLRSARFKHLRKRVPDPESVHSSNCC